MCNCECNAYRTLYCTALSYYVLLCPVSLCSTPLQDGTTDVIIPDMRADTDALILSATDVQASLVMDSVRQHTAAHPPTHNSNASSSLEGSGETGSSARGGDVSSSLSSVVLEEEGVWLRQFQSTTPVQTGDKDAPTPVGDASEVSTVPCKRGVERGLRWRSHHTLHCFPLLTTRHAMFWLCGLTH